MRMILLVRSLLLAVLILALPIKSSANVILSITIAPPPLPVYEQPLCPGDGYIWTPGHWENRATRQVWVAGRFIKDDYQEQLALYNVPAGTMVATGPTTLRDNQGYIIPTNPEAYPVQSATR